MAPCFGPDRLLKLDLPKDRFLGKALGGRAVAPLERMFGLDKVNDIYDHCVARPLPGGLAGPREFIRRLLADMNIRYRVSPEDLARIPKAGAFVAVANHPFGALDGIILSALLGEVRDDTRTMANYLIGKVPELRDLFILVDPFGGPDAAKKNIGPMRQSLRVLRDGHPLAAFPAGEVAHLRLKNLRDGEAPVTDPAWHPTIARIIRRAEVPVLPVYFEGRNDALFQAAGLIHPLLRTALLPRAFLGKQDAVVTVRIGSLVPAKRAAGFDTEEALTDYLRRRTFLLRHGAPRPSVTPAGQTLLAIGDSPDSPGENAGFARSHAALGTVPPGGAAGISTALSSAPSIAPLTAPSIAPSITPLTNTSAAIATAPRSSDGARSPFIDGAARAAGAIKKAAGWRPFSPPAKVDAEPVVSAVPADLLEADLAALPSDALLLETEEMAVYAARAPQMRNLLREIGRLREVTFRLVGEGTGKSLDLDTFDYDYTHLFIWNRAKKQIVGAYRLGQTDQLLPAKGRLGLYTSTLFNYKAELLKKLDPALEMGRSFVRPEYQKSYSPLLLLWKGIGHYLVLNPKYRYLFGPVSISNAYQQASRQVMVQFLKMHHAMPGGEALASPRNPFKPKRALKLGSGNWDDVGIRRLLADDDQLADVIADLEPDQKGIPVLVRQYLKLGAKFVSFNVDRDFGDCLDGLIVVDLAQTEARVLERYMTKVGYARYIATHR